MSTLLAGERMLRRSFDWVVAVVVAPVGSMNVLEDWMYEWVVEGTCSGCCAGVTYCGWNGAIDDTLFDR